MPRDPMAGQWTLIATVAGVIGSSTLELFRWLVSGIEGILLSTRVPIPVSAAIVYLTMGSGMSAGLTAPAIQIGMLAAIAGSHVVAPSADPALLSGFLVVGFSGMLAGAMNVPIAAAVLGIEVFGVGFGVPAAIASIVAFQMNRHTTIYDFALAGSGHLDEFG